MDLHIYFDKVNDGETLHVCDDCADQLVILRYEPVRDRAGNREIYETEIGICQMCALH